LPKSLLLPEPRVKLNATSRMLWVPALLLSFSTAAAQQAASGDQAGAPVSYASVSQLNTLLSQLEQTSQKMQGDLGRMRIERWKTDSNNKRSVQNNVESIQRNLQTALPAVIAELRASPENLNTTFKLYRNLDALYDVVGTVVETAGAFGNKDEFQSLGNDYDALEGTRRSLAERLDNLTQAKESELTHLRAQVHALQAAVPPPPPKKVIVDDTEEPKKPAPKKKSTTSKPATKPSTTKPATTPSKPPQ